MIDPRRLRVLQAVAAHGSVAGAARALCLTPPAVSQQLLALKRETGASLIDRAGRQVALTAAGRPLAAHGERIAAQLRQAERDLAELTGQAAGPVRIAAFQSVMASRPLTASVSAATSRPIASWPVYLTGDVHTRSPPGTGGGPGWENPGRTGPPEPDSHRPDS
jgi:DNA-binding transcriptional LysR family regulator